MDLAHKGFYDGMLIQRSDGFVVQSGKPESGVSLWEQHGSLCHCCVVISEESARHPDSMGIAPVVQSIRMSLTRHS